MGYEHLRWSYPGAYDALKRAHKAREEKLKQLEFSAICNPVAASTTSTGPPAPISGRYRFFSEKLPRYAVIRRKKKSQPKYSAIAPGNDDEEYEPVFDPPRVNIPGGTTSLVFGVDESLAPGGKQVHRDTEEARQKQMMSQHHVNHERAPDGGFFASAGADGTDFYPGVVKPHRFKRNFYALAGRITGS